MASFEQKSFDETSSKNYWTDYEFDLTTFGYFLCLAVICLFCLKWLLQKLRTTAHLQAKEDENFFENQFKTLHESRQKLQDQYNNLSAVYTEKIQTQKQTSVKPEKKNENVSRRRFNFNEDGASPLSRSSGSCYKPSPRFGNASGG